MMQALGGLLETRREQNPALTRQDLLREVVARYLRAERRKPSPTPASGSDVLLCPT
jgi:hypothetical protein